MIDTTKLKPGDKVRVRMDAKSVPQCSWVEGMNPFRGRVLTFRRIDKDEVQVKETDDWVFHSSWLDPVEPKRVEVVTETRTVVKEVVIRLPVDMAKQIASVCGLPGWDEYSKQIHAALAGQVAKS